MVKICNIITHSQILDFIRGTDSPESRRSVAIHVADCRECLRDYSLTIAGYIGGRATAQKRREAERRARRRRFKVLKLGGSKS